jgi:hypothetical protein
MAGRHAQARWPDEKEFQAINWLVRAPKVRFDLAITHHTGS